MLALSPLDEAFRIKRVVYSTYQAVSGAGRNGIIDLENGIKAFSTSQGMRIIYTSKVSLSNL